MKQKIEENIAIPAEIICEYKDKIFTCKKDSIEISKKINIPNVNIAIKDNLIYFKGQKTTKRERKKVNSYIKHIGNMFSGVNEGFIYKLESCNVHFPMTLKIEGEKLLINNFLGEKISRHAKILPNVDVQIKGNMITVSSPDKEAAGQTAANFEKATKIKARDRRIFQDGIFIAQKPEGRK